jgi:hypothetical protein
VPVAENCWFWPIKSEPGKGLIEIAVRIGTGASRVRFVELETELRLAMILVDPTDTLVARPVGLIVATPKLEDAQVTLAEISAEVPSL